MKTMKLIALLGLALSGCNSPASGPSNVSNSDKPNVKSDNTGVNVRDRESTAKTPIDQNENQADIDVTAKIRKQIVDSKLSVNAKNVKIITQDGQVTLRGPVESDAEKQQVESVAQRVAGEDKVDSQLEVKSKK